MTCANKGQNEVAICPSRSQWETDKKNGSEKTGARLDDERKGSRKKKKKKTDEKHS